MNNANTTLATKAGLSTLERAKFGPGMLLQHGDLELLNSYTRELSRLMFKSLFGCGVVCGLVVEPDAPCGKLSVKVKSGVALACSGDPIYVPRAETIAITDDCETEIDGPLWVVLCGTVKCCAPRPSICPSDEEDTKPECTREKDGYVIKVVSGDRPECVCGCDENDAAWNVAWNPDCKCVNPDLVCYKPHYDGDCGCDCAECSDCKCDCILLAKLTEYGDNNEWDVDYRVRRFVRPVLMRDPKVEGPNTVVYSESHATAREVYGVTLTAAKGAIMEAAQNAAFSAAKAAMKQMAPELGEKAVREIMLQIKPKEVAVEAAKEVIKEAEEGVASYGVDAEPATAEKSVDPKASSKNKKSPK